MVMDAETIAQLILSALPDAEIEINDLRGDGTHFSAIVTAKAFTGKSRVDQHRMVYTALKEVLNEQLHALSLQTIISS